uniref:Uncharacterized protein n=1 Tax=Sphaerodactylus townsendi TaxID=933632 RepID=A0ACB8FMQ7_9SAUR
MTSLLDGRLPLMVLTEDSSFSEWRARLRALLNAEDLIHVLDETPPGEDATAAVRTESNSRACAFIIQLRGTHNDQTKPRQDWLMYPVTNDAQRDDSADLDDNQDVFDEPEEIPDVDVEPEYLPIPAAVAEGEEIPRDEASSSVKSPKQFLRAAQCSAISDTGWSSRVKLSLCGKAKGTQLQPSQQ